MHAHARGRERAHAHFFWRTRELQLHSLTAAAGPERSRAVELPSCVSKQHALTHTLKLSPCSKSRQAPKPKAQALSPNFGPLTLRLDGGPSEL